MWSRILGGCVMTLAGQAASHPEQPPPGHSGAPGEANCGLCHYGAEPANGDTLRMDGMPDRYMTGQRYTLTILLRNPGARQGGFQLTVRDGDGQQAGTLQAGTRDSSVQLVNDLQYLGHAPARGMSGGAAIAWDLEWTAPATPGPVHFHLAAVAGNDDASPLGDAVHVLHRILPAVAD